MIKLTQAGHAEPQPAHEGNVAVHAIINDTDRHLNLLL